MARIQNEADKMDSEIPRDFASVPPPMLDYSFTLQAIMEVQRSIGQLTEATHQLGSTINALNDRTKTVEDELSKINGKLTIAASLLAILLVVSGYIVDKVWDSAWTLIAEQIKK